jgi:hypothetical protein
LKDPELHRWEPYRRVTAQQAFVRYVKAVLVELVNSLRLVSAP